MKKTLLACAILAAVISVAPLALANSLSVTYSPTLSAPPLESAPLKNVYVGSYQGSFLETETFTNLTGDAVDDITVGAPSVHDHDNAGNAPGAGNPNDKVTSVSIIGDTCQGADLTTSGPGDSCYVELQVFVTGAAPSGVGDLADGYGDSKISLAVDGEGGEHGTTAVNTNGEFVATVDYAPEPRSLVLMGTGFGLLGLGVFLRRKYAEAHPKTA